MLQMSYTGVTDALLEAGKVFAIQEREGHLYLLTIAGESRDDILSEDISMNNCGIRETMGGKKQR